MNKTFFKAYVLVTFFISFHLYSEDQTMFCHALDGLNIRAEANEKGKVIGKLAYGDTVKITKTIPGKIKVGGMSGSWLETSIGDKKGYIFGGWLSKYKTPDVSQSVDDYISYFDDAKIAYQKKNSPSKDGVTTLEYVLKNISVQEVFMILRSRDRDTLKDISLSQKTQTTKLKNNGMDVAETKLTQEFDNNSEVNSIKIQTVWIQSSGESNYYINKNKDSSVTLKQVMIEP